MSSSVPEESVLIRIPRATRAELDALGQAMARDESVLIVEAVEAYLAVHRWQVAHIAEGVRQADAGEFADDSEVAAAYDSFR